MPGWLRFSRASVFSTLLVSSRRADSPLGAVGQPARPRLRATTAARQTGVLYVRLIVNPPANGPLDRGAPDRRRPTSLLIPCQHVIHPTIQRAGKIGKTEIS